MRTVSTMRISSLSTLAACLLVLSQTYTANAWTTTRPGDHLNHHSSSIQTTAMIRSMTLTHGDHTVAARTFDNILEDSAGNINRDLAERIWNWEQERRSVKDLPKVEYSVRSGLRLLDSIVEDVWSKRVDVQRTRSQSDSIIYGELVQEGLSALLNAMSMYRGEDNDEDFETHASQQIRKALAHTIEEDVRQIRLPRGVSSIAKEAATIVARGGKDGKKLSIQEVAEELGVPVSRLRDYLRLAKATGNALSMESTVGIINPALENALYRDQEEFESSQGFLLDNGRLDHRTELVDEYLDETLQREGDDDSWVQQEQIAGPLHDLIPDSITGTPSSDDTLLAQQMIRSDLSEFLVYTLDPQESEVVLLYFGLDSRIPMSSKATAKKLNISERQVSDLLRRGLRKLRESHAKDFEVAGNEDMEYVEESV